MIAEHFGGLRCSLVGLTPQSPWGTDLPLAASYWQCVTGHHAGYHSTTDPSRQRATVNSLPPSTVSRMLAPNTRTKWQHHSSDQEAMTPSPEEEEAVSLDVTLEEHPHQRHKGGGPLQGSSRRVIRKPSEKTPTSSELLGNCISRCSTLTLTMRDPRISPTLSSRLSDEHNHAVFSQYYRSFIISKVPYLTCNKIYF